MARVNFEDDVESQKEFWRLLPLVGGSRALALGKLLLFFRIAQKAWGHDIPMTREELIENEFQDMIESGWAVPCGVGFHALGAAKHFGWYRQRCQSGEARARGERDENGRFKSSETPADDQRNSISYQPLAPSLSPSLALTINTKKEKFEGLTECLGEYQDTLNFFKIGGGVGLAEGRIAALLQRYGFESTRLAIIGMRFEPKTETFNPAEHFSSARLADSRFFEKFVNLGRKSQNKIKAESVTKIRREEPDIERTDPSRVREILKKAGL